MSTRGRAGSNLSTFVGGAGAAGKAAGARGEELTASLLEQVSATGCYVQHSVRVNHGRADVDHVVIGRRGLVIIDSKCLRPGTYITIMGRTWALSKWRLRRAAHLDSTSLFRSAQDMRDHQIKVRGVLVCPHASRAGRVRTLLARYVGARYVSPESLTNKVLRLAGAGAPDPETMSLFASWVSLNH